MKILVHMIIYPKKYQGMTNKIKLRVHLKTFNIPKQSLCLYEYLALIYSSSQVSVANSLFAFGVLLIFIPFIIVYYSYKLASCNHFCITSISSSRLLFSKASSYYCSSYSSLSFTSFAFPSAIFLLISSNFFLSLSYFSLCFSNSIFVQSSVILVIESFTLGKFS